MTGKDDGGMTDKFVNGSRNPGDPTVSIIMPAYKAERTIAFSMKSVIAQTYADWELLVIDDFSPDATRRIVESAAEDDPRIVLCANEKRLGVAGSRNAGIRIARGEWIAFLDADDLWREDKLEKQMRFMAETGAGISYTATAYMDVDGVMSTYILRAEREFGYRDLLRRNLMSCSSVMVRRDIMTRVMFTEKTEKKEIFHEDYVAWMRILRETGCAYGLDEPLLIYRMSKTSVSAKRFRSAAMTYQAYRCVNYNPAVAAALTLRYALHSIPKRAAVRKGWKRTSVSASDALQSPDRITSTLSPAKPGDTPEEQSGRIDTV